MNFCLATKSVKLELSSVTTNSFDSDGDADSSAEATTPAAAKAISKSENQRLDDAMARSQQHAVKS